MAACPRCGDFVTQKWECAKCGPVPDPQQRTMAAIGYFWVTALVFLFTGLAPQTRFVRFHCLQAVFYGLAVLVVNMALWAVAAFLDPFGAVMLVYRTVSFLIELALLMVWVLAALKAYLGEEYALPGIGGLARKYST
jgi:uncharacterized membrane protein